MKLACPQHRVGESAECPGEWTDHSLPARSRVRQRATGRGLAPGQGPRPALRLEGEDAPQGLPRRAATLGEVGSAGPLPSRRAETQGLDLTGSGVFWMHWGARLDRRCRREAPALCVHQPSTETLGFCVLGLWLLVPTTPSLKLYFLSDVLTHLLST